MLGGSRRGLTEGSHAPGAVIVHHHALTLSLYWRQHSTYGAGATQLHRIIAADAVVAPHFEGARFHRDLIVWPLRRHGAAGFHAAGLLLSQIAMIHGYGRALHRLKGITYYNTTGTG